MVRGSDGGRAALRGDRSAGSSARCAVGFRRGGTGSRPCRPGPRRNAAAVLLDSAVVDVEQIRGRVAVTSTTTIDPTMIGVAGFPAAVQAAVDGLGDGGIGAVAGRLRVLADAANAAGLDKGGMLAVQTAARLALKKGLQMLASEAAEQIGAAFAGVGDETELQGHRIEWIAVKPTDAPKPLSSILDSIVSGVTARIYLPAGAADVVAVYTAYCYVFDHWPIRPLLAISSPVKQCGKTTLLDLLMMLVPKAYEAGGITAAALFRMIAAHRPILLLDECDQWLHGAGAKSEKAGDLIACINAGWKVGGVILRCVGDEHETRGFPVDTPKILAGIGDFPDTIARTVQFFLLSNGSRVICALESVRADRPIGAEIRAQLVKWASDHGTIFAEQDPPMGRWTNRAADNWRPLFAVADMAGGAWPTRIRRAADAVTGRAAERATSADHKSMLLMDCRRVFDEAGCPFLASKMLDGALHAMEDRLWGDYRGKPLSAQLRGRWLTGFGIRAGKSERDERGYHRRDFEAAWKQYSPASTGTVETVETVESPASIDRASDGSDGSDGSIRERLPDFPPGALNGSASGDGADLEGLAGRRQAAQSSGVGKFRAAQVALGIEPCPWSAKPTKSDAGALLDRFIALATTTRH